MCAHESNTSVCYCTSRAHHSVPSFRPETRKREATILDRSISAILPGALQAKKVDHRALLGGRLAIPLALWHPLLLIGRRWLERPEPVLDVRVEAHGTSSTSSVHTGRGAAACNAAPAAVRANGGVGAHGKVAESRCDAARGHCPWRRRRGRPTRMHLDRGQRQAVTTGGAGARHESCLVALRGVAKAEWRSGEHHLIGHAAAVRWRGGRCLIQATPRLVRKSRGWRRGARWH